MALSRTLLPASQAIRQKYAGNVPASARIIYRSIPRYLHLPGDAGLSRVPLRRPLTVSSKSQPAHVENLSQLVAGISSQIPDQREGAFDLDDTLAKQFDESNLHESGSHRLVTSSHPSAEVVLVQQRELDSSTARTILTKSETAALQSKVVPVRWLRENCRCSDCVNPDTLQRNINVLSTSQDIVSAVYPGADGFQIQWNRGTKDGKPHTSYYSDVWLRKALFQQYPFRDADELKDGRPQRTFFDQSLRRLPEVQYDEVVQGSKTVTKGMGTLTDHIMRTGFVLVRGCPATPEATQSLLEKIGPIRTTHYGGFYDFQPNLEFRDTAYTNEALELHTDTTYFTEPAGLQAFHLLSHKPPPGRSAEGGKLGGESRLLDGLHCAERLLQESPEAYDILCNTELPWHASGNEEVAIAPLKPYPVIERSSQGVPFRIRWNNADRGVVPTTAGALANDWYNAAAKFQALLLDPAMNLQLQLEPGTILIFDNWRVLHGRTSFEGARRMAGGYINRDDFVSKWRLTQAPREEVVESIMSLDTQTL